MHLLVFFLLMYLLYLHFFIFDMPCVFNFLIHTHQSSSFLVCFQKLQHRSSNIMQSSIGGWISVAAAIFILLVITPTIESSPAFHRADENHHNSLSRCYNSFRKASPFYQRTLLPSTLQPGEIDPRFEIDKRLIPGGPNPLHN